MLPLPVLHGCTIGELAQMINGEGWIDHPSKNPCPLTVIPVTGWKHGAALCTSRQTVAQPARTHQSIRLVCLTLPF